jgi:CubicO group peptidase (beta-lactamase class C family)
MFAAIALIAAVAAAPAPPTAITQRPHPEIQALADKLDGWLVAADFRGNALVSKGGVVLLRKGYGKSDRENGVPYDADTVFSIGSITKQFTAAAILKLEMQGKLRVEDPISKYFPGAPDDKKAITLHQLLTHSSGLDSDFAGDYDPMSRHEYVKRILASKLRTKPGDAYHYANSGYSLLGAVVEIVSGVGYEKYLRENLFLPAGMKDTGYKLPGWPPAKIAVGYKGGKRWGRITDKPWADDGPYWALRANGGIHSTLDDMLRWNTALSGDTILSAAAKAKMFKGHVREGAGADTFYGYGWSIGESAWGSRLIEHDGGNGTTYADFLRYPDDDLVVILSTNDSEVKGARISHALARLTHGGDVPVPKPGPVAVKPLGTTGRDAVIRGWFDAFNAEGMEPMRAFRAAHQVPRPEMTDAERDQRLTQMRDDLGQLTPERIVDDADEKVTVRAKGANGPTGLFTFMFNPDGKIEGIGVELGN